jgi:hypothetical protein
MFGNKNPKILGELAFDSSSKQSHTLYLKEDGEYHPYVVLTKNYNRNTLVLRQEILQETLPMDCDSSFYKESDIDRYLNESFVERFSLSMLAAITDSTIEITALESIDRVGAETIFIIRKVFLLSHAEVGFHEHPMAAQEGSTLQYFKDYENRIAYKNEQAYSWWLRTPYTGYATTSWIVGSDSSMIESGIEADQGIRPAFCLNGKSKIEKIIVNSDGSEGFVLLNDE